MNDQIHSAQGSSNPPSPLSDLERDHASGLVFADELARVAANGSDAEYAAAIEALQRYNSEELEPHLQQEEQTILRPLLQDHPEHRDLCIRIGQEHGRLRILAERMSERSPRPHLSEFARLLKAHTLLEDESLLPLVERLLTPDQLEAVGRFKPLGRPAPPQETTPRPDRNPAHGYRWFERAVQFLACADKDRASIILLPKFDPELAAALATRLDLTFFDYQQTAMAPLGREADTLTLDQLSDTLRHESARRGLLAHNVEALLCVKAAEQRRGWLQETLDGIWPNPLVLPVAVYHDDVPDGHPRVFDPERPAVS